MRKKFQKLNPSNSRIFINLNDKKNPVSFEYPRIEHAFKIVFPTFLGLWIIFLLISAVITGLIFFGSAFLFNNPVEVDITGESSESHISTENDNLPKSVTINLQPNLDIGRVIWVVMILLSVLSFIFIPPIGITLITIKSNYLLSKIPEFYRRIETVINRGHYYIKKKKLKSNIFEIPILDNIFLDFKVKGDFKKQLSKVEILEHNLYTKKVNLFGKKKKFKQTDSWYAKFYFNNIPKNGYLEVDYL